MSVHWPVRVPWTVCNSWCPDYIPISCVRTGTSWDQIRTVSQDLCGRVRHGFVVIFLFVSNLALAPRFIYGNFGCKIEILSGRCLLGVKTGRSTCWIRCRGFKGLGEASARSRRLRSVWGWRIWKIRKRSIVDTCINFTTASEDNRLGKRVQGRFLKGSFLAPKIFERRSWGLPLHIFIVVSSSYEPRFVSVPIRFASEGEARSGWDEWYGKSESGQLFDTCLSSS